MEIERDDLPASILTPTQRTYLQTPKEERDSSPDYDRATRSRIRRRLIAALIDLELLAAGLEARDRERAFAGVGHDTEFQPYISYVVRGMELLFAGLLDSDTDKNGRPANESTFQKVVQDSLLQALLQHEKNVIGVTVDIDIEYASDSYEKQDSYPLEERSEQVLKLMLSFGEISSDDFIEAMEAKREDR